MRTNDVFDIAIYSLLVGGTPSYGRVICNLREIAAIGEVLCFEILNSLLVRTNAVEFNYACAVENVQ